MVAPTLQLLRALNQSRRISPFVRLRSAFSLGFPVIFLLLFKMAMLYEDLIIFPAFLISRLFDQHWVFLFSSASFTSSAEQRGYLKLPMAAGLLLFVLKLPSSTPNPFLVLNPNGSVGYIHLHPTSLLSPMCRKQMIFSFANSRHGRTLPKKQYL